MAILDSGCIMPGSPGLAAQPRSTPGAGRHLPSIDGARARSLARGFTCHPCLLFSKSSTPVESILLDLEAFPLQVGMRRVDPVIKIYC